MFRSFVLPVLAFAATGFAQDRLPSMPGFDNHAKMSELRNGAVVRGDVRGTWSADSKGFIYNWQDKQWRVDTATGAVAEFTGDAPPRDRTQRGPNANAGRRRPDRGRQFAEAFTQDGLWKAYTKDNNVFIVDKDAKKKPIQVTKDGDKQKKIKYGVGSWVYGEELGQSEAMGFAGDGKYLWYYRFDESKVPEYYLAMSAVNVQDTLDVEPYPKAGAPNPEVELFIYDRGKRKKIQVDVREGRPFDEGIGHYVYGISWSPDNQELWFHRANRLQNTMEFCAADPKTGKVRVIVHEEWRRSWVDNQPQRTYLDEDPNIEQSPQYKGKAIWLSERTGYSNYYLLDLKTGDITPITKNPFEVASIVRVDLAKNRLFYMARDGSSPYRQQLHRVGLDGKGDVRLTDPALNHMVSLSPDCESFTDIAETIDTPPSTRLVDSTGKILTTLATGALTEFKTRGFQTVERFEYTAADGLTKLYGTLSKPANFDQQKKYPLLVSVYAGPESGSGSEKFTMPDADTDYGFLQASFDGRGTSGRGKAFKDEMYRKMGVVEIDDQAAGVKFLEQRPYVDVTKVGIEGTSYGGYASAMAILRYPDLFQAACACSPVTDWHNYDSIYTERYMGLPSENEKGYKEGSAMTYAGNLKGRLLLFYGTSDNNVHPANTYQLVQELQRKRKWFEVQIGPDWGHSGVSHERMMEFFIGWLVAGKGG
jgi:dipeptidyl-peptidase-4